MAVYDPAPLTGNHLYLQISKQPRRDFSESNVTLSEKFTGLLDDDHHAATWQWECGPWEAKLTGNQWIRKHPETG
jgi:hypothetical protein